MVSWDRYSRNGPVIGVVMSRTGMLPFLFIRFGIEVLTSLTSTLLVAGLNTAPLFGADLPVVVAAGLAFSALLL